MSDVLDSISTYLVISLGSLTGAIFRIKITYFFKLRNSHNLKAIFIVNTIAIFLLGFFLGSQNPNIYFDSNNYLYLFLCTGILGSFSTFSSLVYELYRLFIKYRWIDLIFYSMSSIFVGIFFAKLGYLLGNA